MKPVTNDIEARVNGLLTDYSRAVRFYRGAIQAYWEAQQGISRTNEKGTFFVQEAAKCEKILTTRYKTLANLALDIENTLEGRAGTFYGKKGERHEVHFSRRKGNVKLVPNKIGSRSPISLQYLVEDTKLSQQPDDSRGHVKLHHLREYKDGKGYERLAKHSGLQNIPNTLSQSDAKRLTNPEQPETTRIYKPKQQPSERLIGTGV